MKRVDIRFFQGERAADWKPFY